jgi:ABC-type nickel/cobalt efflux system permease component RcnA
MLEKLLQIFEPLVMVLIMSAGSALIVCASVFPAVSERQPIRPFLLFGPS